MTAARTQIVVLITGHSGFTGRHTAAHLRAHQPAVRIVGLDRRADPHSPVHQQFVGDIGNADVIESALAASRPDTLIHLAGYMPPTPEVRLWSANVAATLTLLDGVRRHAPSTRVLVTGSATEYGPSDASALREDHPCRPVTAYGRTKLAQTRLARSYWLECGLPVVVARTFNVYGPGMSSQAVIGRICVQLAQAHVQPTIRLGDLSSTRDFVDVRDAVAAYWALSQRGDAGEIYNVCSARATPIRAVVDLLLDLAGGRCRVESRPDPNRAAEPQYSCGDNSKLVRQTGVRPEITLRDGLRTTLAWFRANAAGQARPTG